MKLAILICNLTSRKDLCERLCNALCDQIQREGAHQYVTLFIGEDNGQTSTGAKRNELLQTAIENGAEYIAYADDDDLPGDNYIKHQLAAANSGMDCGSLWGQIYWNGKEGKPFHHSIQYDRAWEDNKFYYRAPNHLNCIKLDLVKEIKFQEKNFGEDGCWMEDIHKAGVLKTEHKTYETIYHYFCGQPKYKI